MSMCFFSFQIRAQSSASSVPPGLQRRVPLEGDRLASSFSECFFKAHGRSARPPVCSPPSFRSPVRLVLSAAPCQRSSLYISSSRRSSAACESAAAHLFLCSACGCPNSQAPTGCLSRGQPLRCFQQLKAAARALAAGWSRTGSALRYASHQFARLLAPHPHPLAGAWWCVVRGADLSNLEGGGGGARGEGGRGRGLC
jgi:hypothetical protein